MKTCNDCEQYVIRMGESQPICWFADQQSDDYPEVRAYRDANQGGDMSQCPEFELYTPIKQITLRMAETSTGKPVLRMAPSIGKPTLRMMSTSDLSSDDDT